MNLEEYINEFLEYCEIERGHSALTTRNYEHYLERLLDFIRKQKRKENPKISDINQDLIKKYRLYLNRLDAEYGESLKKITQNYHLIALRAFFEIFSKKRHPCANCRKD